MKERKFKKDSTRGTHLYSKYQLYMCIHSGGLLVQHSTAEQIKLTG
jgi:hypothetical protein